MRVLYVISTLDRCGPVNVLYEIVSNLADGDEAIVATLADEPDGTRIQEFRELDCCVVQVFDTRVESIFGGAAFRKFVVEVKPDVVHAHGLRADSLCGALDVPTVSTVHNRLAEDFIQGYGPFVGRVFTWRERYALRRIDRIIACSETNAECLRSVYGLDVASIRNGVDTNRYHPANDFERQTLRRCFGIEYGEFVFVAAGACSSRKRTQELLGSFEASHLGVQARLFIVGGGPLYQELVSRYGRNERITFMGQVSDVRPYLWAADCFVSLSSSEGMPLAVLEALCCGLPAILSDIPAHREVAGVVSPVRDDAVTLVQQDRCAVVDALTRLAASPPTRLTSNETAPIFSSKVMARRYRSLYEQLSGRRKESL